MSRRSLTLLIAGLATLVAIAVAVLVPVPYVILGPGPTLNTLGSQGGQPLITISGHPTYPTTGNLNMVTVGYQGNPPPNTGINVFEALRAWLDPSEAVVPATEIYTPGQSAAQTQQEDTAEMAGSQETAQAAAFSALPALRTVTSASSVAPSRNRSGAVNVLPIPTSAPLRLP